MMRIFRIPGWLAFPALLFPWQAPLADAEQDYNLTCAACHNLGVAGAPRIGNMEAWTDRVAQGMAVLTRHAIDGFTGEAGVMPPKGGFTELTDEQVEAIVAYMVSRSSGD
jgi:cytochrome c5